MTVWRLRRFGGRSGADSFGGRGDHESRGGHRGHSKSWPTTAVPMIALLCGCLALLGARVHVLEVGRAAPSFQRAAAEGQHVTFEARLSGFPEKKRTSFGDREWVRIEAFVPVPQSGSTGPDAVSYTHLDVYKRQAPDVRGRTIARRRLVLDAAGAVLSIGRDSDVAHRFVSG